MKAWKRFEDWANVVLGAYLFFVPFIVAANAASASNAYIVGVLFSAWRSTRSPSRTRRGPSGPTWCSGRG